MTTPRDIRGENAGMSNKKSFEKNNHLEMDGFLHLVNLCRGSWSLRNPQKGCHLMGT